MNSSSTVLQHAEKTSGEAIAMGGSEALAYDNVLDNVYTYIADNSDAKAITVSKEGVKQRQEQILRLIREYVEKNKPRVEKENGAAYTITELTSLLIDDITRFGVLTPAYVDPDVSEIQINDYQTIWVEKSGSLQIMRDEVSGERVQFKDQEECFKIIQKLLRNSKSKFSKEDTIAKGRTPEGFRIAAVHAEAVAAEKGKHQDRSCSPACVIRKFPENSFTVKDLVSFKSMTAEMGNAISTLPKADVTIIVVGPTGSGKTVLLQMVLNNVPSNMRIYAIENPSELALKRYNEKGQPINNVVQFEALADSTKADQEKTSRHTEINLMMQALRMTPHYYVFGEVRYNTEINEAMTAANTGHKFVTSFHAPDDKGGIRRVSNGVIACNPGMPPNTVLEGVCANIDFIFVQEKQWDKSRKVMQMTEVDGVIYEDGVARPNLRRIFEFRPERKRPGDKKMRGSHWQVGNFSPDMLNRMMSSSMDVTEFDLISIPLEKDKDGNDMPRKGHYDENLLLDMERAGAVGVEVAVRETLMRAVQKFKDRPEKMKNFIPTTFMDGTYEPIEGTAETLESMRRSNDNRCSKIGEEGEEEGVHAAETEQEKTDPVTESLLDNEMPAETDVSQETTTVAGEAPESKANDDETSVNPLAAIDDQEVVGVGYGPNGFEVATAKKILLLDQKAEEAGEEVDLDAIEEAVNNLRKDSGFVIGEEEKQ